MAYAVFSDPRFSNNASSTHDMPQRHLTYTWCDVMALDSMLAILLELYSIMHYMPTAAYQKLDSTYRAVKPKWIEYALWCSAWRAEQLKRIVHRPARHCFKLALRAVLTTNRWISLAQVINRKILYANDAHKNNDIIRRVGVQALTLHIC
jgi:hypothetical protein